MSQMRKVMCAEMCLVRSLTRSSKKSMPMEWYGSSLSAKLVSTQVASGHRWLSRSTQTLVVATPLSGGGRSDIG
jgi:hypothetical protein